MKTKLTLGLLIFSITNLFASTGAEQAKMLVMALAGVVIIILSSFRNNKKSKKDEN
ncbi:hypothetical protein [Lutibacter sp.]|uniref:hypothetical protein n=1 Tax=Lutibacter sp. TaxID=1925666 RepID=UPI002734BDB4|nr:hypothetical protein [Lutibacter sp.]MDP3314387.1 hypothetical protein [Lutibacter sp.]